MPNLCKYSQSESGVNVFFEAIKNVDGLKQLMLRPHLLERDTSTSLSMTGASAVLPSVMLSAAQRSRFTSAVLPKGRVKQASFAAPLGMNSIYRPTST